MADFVAMIRDTAGNGVLAEAVEGWGRYPADPSARTRVHLAGGGVVDMHIPRREFVQRLDEALTALRNRPGAQQ